MKTLYRLRHYHVCAIRAYRKNIEEVMEFLGVPECKPKFDDVPAECGFSMYLPTDTCSAIIVREGDWIVKSHTGWYSTETHKHFQRIYEELP